MFQDQVSVIFIDGVVSVNGEGYDVDLSSYKDDKYDVISWNNGKGFTQKFPGIRVTTFKGTQDEYDKYVQPFYSLWEIEKTKADIIANTPPTPEELEEIKKQQDANEFLLGMVEGYNE